jgi:hypothetical protein
MGGPAGAVDRAFAMLLNIFKRLDIFLVVKKKPYRPLTILCSLGRQILGGDCRNRKSKRGTP